jgi:hypothetical protein
MGPVWARWSERRRYRDATEVMRRIFNSLTGWLYPTRGTNPAHARGAVKVFWLLAAVLFVVILVVWVAT